MTEPYIKRNPGDFITAQDWNDLQVKIRAVLNSHSHNGEDDQGIKLKQDENFSNLNVKENLNVGKSISATETLNADKISFGAKVKQMIDLWKSDYGIGIQKRTQYYRSGKNFAWYKGGSHNNDELNPGGGIVFMVIKDGNVGIGTENPGAKLDVKGGIYAGTSDLYFTDTDHIHTGIGNTEGFAAIENSKDYDGLMILGRSEFKDGKFHRRKVKLWDYLQINGNLDVTGRIMPNFESDWIHLENASYKEYKVAHNLNAIPSMVQVFAKSDGKSNGNKLTHGNDVRVMSFNNDSYKDSDNDRAGLSCRCINNKELVFFRNGHIWHGYEAGEFFNSGYVKFIMWR